MSTASPDRTSNREEQTPLTSSSSASTGKTTTEQDDKQGSTVTVFELTSEIKKCLKDLEDSIQSNDEKFEKTMKRFESKIKTLE
ncbi:hypothetical protein ZYGR_0U01660 [Zygosaccharomyces rouxii]|uniref:ZYRO0F12408p n=2 Tax=Zygosaccharomyces rouxii TaxID=4956 RepID=C5DYE6_ZYGRC|nr:uncharacterized protein ZYRO0F12408g [Zygosaccharomyces rouxii]GAV50310.1 hypothetical protein ZYGR_0U01660 [Zygosaccharomyces rouxii]CAR28807.1 ZYRO0F12408p [Zygosaccharomyces rouxii]